MKARRQREPFQRMTAAFPLPFLFIYKDLFYIFLFTILFFLHINEGIEEILADHVHQEMTRNFILVYFRLFLVIVIKDVFLKSFFVEQRKSKNQIDIDQLILGCYETYRPCVAEGTFFLF